MLYGYICFYLIHKQSGNYKDQCSLSCLPTGPCIHVNKNTQIDLLLVTARHRWD